MEPPADVAQYRSAGVESHEDRATAAVSPLAVEGGGAQGRRGSLPSHGLMLDLGLFVVGIGYENFVAPRVSMQVSGHVFRTWLGPALDRPNLGGLGGTLRPTIFLTDDGPRGVYVAPFVRIDRVSSDEDGATSEWGYSTGGFVGYSWVRGEHFNVRLGAGVQWMAYESHVGVRRDSFSGFFPAIDIVVGYVR